VGSKADGLNASISALRRASSAQLAAFERTLRGLNASILLCGGRQPRPHRHRAPGSATHR